jgi:hypothetical protein
MQARRERLVEAVDKLPGILRKKKATHSPGSGEVWPGEPDEGP